MHFTKCVFLCEKHSVNRKPSGCLLLSHWEFQDAPHRACCHGERETENFPPAPHSLVLFRPEVQRDAATQTHAAKGAH